MNRHELAWDWFSEKHGLVFDADVADGRVEFTSCTKDFVIEFPPGSSGYGYRIESNKLILNFDPFELFYRALSGGMDGDHDRPFIDELSEALFNAIRELVVRNGDVLISKAFWPNNERFAVCLTHDVDEIRKTYQYVTRSLRFLKRGNLRGVERELRSFMLKLKGKDPYWTFERLMKVEEELGVRSSFYFLKETGKAKILKRNTWRHVGRRYTFDDVADVIRTLASNGWEVGLHGSFYSYLNVDLMKKEKSELERVLGSKVVGIRQHNLNLSVPETWRIQESLGFEYDTSLGSNHSVCFRWGTCFPFNPIDDGRKMRILQIPMIVEDIALMKYENPRETFLKILDAVKCVGGVLTMLWHHSVFGDDYPGWEKFYIDAVNVCKSMGAWIGNCKDLAEWWNVRRSGDVFFEIRGNRLEISSENGVIPVVYTPSAKLIGEKSVVIG